MIFPQGPLFSLGIHFLVLLSMLLLFKSFLLLFFFFFQNLQALLFCGFLFFCYNFLWVKFSFFYFQHGFISSVCLRSWLSWFVWIVSSDSWIQLLLTVVAQIDGGSEAGILFRGLPFKTERNANHLNRRNWNHVRQVSVLLYLCRRNQAPLPTVCVLPVQETQRE